MGGGNSHQRGIERAAKERMAKEVTDTVLKKIAIDQAPAPPPEINKSTNPIAVYLRAIGFVSLIFAIGASLMDSFFWWFVAFTYFGVAISMGDSIIEVSLGKFRWILASFFFLFLIFFTVKVVVGSVYPETTVSWTEGNYPAGTDIHGLIWQDGWSDLEVVIHNNTSTDLKDMDVAFRVDEGVADFKIIGGPKCELIDSDRPSEPTARGEDGVQRLMHQDFSIHGTYRLLCDKVPGGTRVKMMMAIVHPRAAIPGTVGLKTMPRWVVFHFSYRAAGPRPYNWNSRVNPTAY